MSQQASILSFDQARSRGGQPNSRMPRTGSSQSRHAASVASQVRTQTYRRNDTRTQSRPLNYRSSAAQTANDRRRVADRGAVQQVAQQTTRENAPSATNRVRHAVRAKKADREFERYTQRTERNRPQEQSSRPALYQMQMGKTQKRSTRMQREGANPTRTQKPSRKEARRPWWQRPINIALCALLFCGFMLYQPIANLYNETRSLQQLEAEYDALQANNVQVRANLDHLATDEGLEEYAHNELGWIRADEHTARVADVAQPDQSTQQVKRVVTTIPEGSIETPDTWYSPVLDVVFGYSG